MDITQFITDNAVWLIVFGVLILMAMIGYMAEKNGKKEDKGKVSPKEKEQKETKAIEDLEIKDEPIVVTPTSTDVVNDIMDMEETSALQSAPVVEASPENDIPETVTATGEDLTVPLDNSSSIPAEISDLEGVLPSDLEAEISALTAETTSTSATSASEPTLSQNDLAVNDISSLFGETKKEETDSSLDVWKF